jgi:hypothetical protein
MPCSATLDRINRRPTFVQENSRALAFTKRETVWSLIIGRTPTGD